MKLRNLWEYSAARSSLLSKRIYLLASAQEENTDNEAKGRLNSSINTLYLFSALLLYLNIK